MFYGEYRHTVDDKCRLSIPARFRNLLQGDGNEEFYLTRGLDNCILLCTAKKWKDLEEKFSRHSIANQAARFFKRAFYSGANPTTFDRQGRIVLPQNLMEHAGIVRDVVVAGVSDGVEIWDAGKWDEAMVKYLANYEKTAQELDEKNTEK